MKKMRFTRKDMEKFGAYEAFVSTVHRRNKEMEKETTIIQKLEVKVDHFINFMHWMFDDNFVFGEKVARNYFYDHYEYVDNDPDWLTHSNELLDSLR